MSEVKRNSAIAEALGGATGSVAVKIRNLASSSCAAPSASSYYVSASAPGSRRSSICQALEGWASARSSTSSTMHANGKVVFNLSSRLGTLKLKDTPETKDASSGSDSASGSPRVELYLAPAPWRGTSVSTPKAISDQEQVLARWAVESSLIDPSTTYYHKFLKSRIAALSAHTLPDVPVEDTLFFCQLQAFIFTLDDVLDNVEDFRVKDSTDNFLLQSLTQVFAVFKAIVRGEYDSEMKLDSDSDSCASQSANSIATRLASDKERANISSFPLFRPFLKVLLDIRFGAKQVGLDLSWWVECFEKYFDAMAFEHGSRACSVSENTKYNPRLWTYMMNREHTVSYLVSVASFLLLKKVSVPREFVSLHMVHLLLTNATYHVIAVNDIFSYEKELSLNEVDNLLMVDNGRMSLQDVIAHSNNMAKEIADLSQILLVNPGYAVKRAAAGLSNMENASAIIEAFVETVINSVNGHIYWYASSARYGCYRFI